MSSRIDIAPRVGRGWQDRGVVGETGRAAAVVARVAVDVPLPHLDRPFDYAIPEALRGSVRPGVRVRVRFAGRRRDGFVLDTAGEAEPGVKLAPLERVVSDEVVLTPEIAGLVRAVADHYAGTFADVVRLAVPPRHGATENAPAPDYPAPRSELAHGPWSSYPDGEALIESLRAGGKPRVSWVVAPTPAALGDWVAGLVQAAAATVASGRGVVVVVPDVRDLDRVERAFASHFGRGAVARLTADVGPAARYRRFLAAVRGQVRVVIGTRAAVWAPVHDLGLVAVWDDGDDLLAEPRAPYPHVREVAALRANREGAALILAGHARTAEVEALAARGWVLSSALPPAEVRRACAAVRVTADSDRALERDPLARVVRVPHEVFAAVRTGLAAGPVLVQVPLGAQSTTIGVLRTAEEWGKAFPGVPVVTSAGDRIVAEVGDDPALVLATPGAEPAARGGYAAAVLLDTRLALGRADLRGGEEALRRWLAVVALVRPGGDGGTVIAVGEASARAIQALVRIDAPGFARRELDDRREARLPPAWKWVTVTGAPDLLAEAAKELAGLAEVRGPDPVPDSDDRVLTARCSTADAPALLAAVKAFAGVRSARKLPGALRIQVDPQAIA